MRNVVAIVALNLAAGGLAHGQEPICDSTKAIVNSAVDGIWPSAVPSIVFEGQPVTCLRVTDTLVSCILDSFEVCAGKPPSSEAQAAFQSRMMNVYAILPPAMNQCFSDRTAGRHTDAAAMDGYVRQERGQKFTKPGEPTVRLVDSVTRMVDGDYRCETSAASIEIEIE